MFSLGCLVSVAPHLLQTVVCSSDRRLNGESNNVEAPSNVENHSGNDGDFGEYSKVQSKVVAKKMGDLFDQLEEHSKGTNKPFRSCRRFYKEQVISALRSYVEKRYPMNNQRYTEASEINREEVCAEISKDWSPEYLRYEYLKQSHGEFLKAIKAYDSLFECFERLVRKLFETKLINYKGTSVAQFKKEIEELVKDTSKGVIQHANFKCKDTGIAGLSSAENFNGENYWMFNDVLNGLSEHIDNSAAHLTTGEYSMTEDDRSRYIALTYAAAGELEHMTGQDYNAADDALKTCSRNYSTFLEFVNKNQEHLDIIESVTDAFDTQFQETCSDAGAGLDAEQMKDLIEEVAADYTVEAVKNARPYGTEDDSISDDESTDGSDIVGESESVEHVLVELQKESEKPKTTKGAASS
ncbi:hypothetical protein PAPHI01_1447 [Pancytospora philotis]|nr:hypothetical protein PAPHI01_1447 [Pancytospora philotis]